jgi:hypothetical protein
MLFPTLDFITYSDSIPIEPRPPQSQAASFKRAYQTREEHHVHFPTCRNRASDKPLTLIRIFAALQRLRTKLCHE